MTITDRKFYLPDGLTNGEGSLPVAITARIGQSGRLLMSNPDSCKIISKSDQRVLRRVLVCIVQKAPLHQCHVYEQIKILRTVFEEGHPRNIHEKLFQKLTSSFGEEDFLRISSCVHCARSPHLPGPCFWTDQNFANKF